MSNSFLDLTISTRYVPGWGTWEGIRELAQNAIDREREDVPGNDDVARVWSAHPARIDYDETDRVLTISSPDTIIEKSTLILGEGTKREGGRTIGQHGEGYKLAMIALLRNGHTLEIDNGNQRWEASFAFKQNLKTEMLRVTFRKGNPGGKDLVFKIGEVTADQWNEVCEKIRRLHDSGEAIRGTGGFLLTDASERGRLYVGGIYVTDLSSKFMYGYDFDPDRLHLDRDRSTVDSFNLEWECSTLHSGTGEKGLDLAVQSIYMDAPDISRLTATSSRLVEQVAETVYGRFRGQFGDRAYPVTYEWEAQQIKARFKTVKPVIVGDVMKETIKKSSSFLRWLTGQDEIPVDTPETILRKFLERNMEYFSQVLADKFDSEVIERCVKEEWSI